MAEVIDNLIQEQLVLRIDKEISQQMDEVLGKIRKISKDFSIASKDKKSPFRNVLAVATDSSSSLEVIKNYIRYQVGRSGSSPIWTTLKDKELFAKAVVQDLDSLNQDAQTILMRIRKDIPKGHVLEPYLEDNQNRERIKKHIHLKLVQLYLGYLAREHTALVGESTFGK
ncbi:MAG: hypothetical protein C6Y22_11695 [Hapalosiphonaceae cyanobacterium JJU2]|nr:MAG: hypothetical protein C6Y22_11695 [Hapalosiphonaceae cyanobacterium JJU2]